MSSGSRPNPGDNTVSVIDGATNTAIATVPVGNSPEEGTVDSVTHAVYVANEGSTSTVSVITQSAPSDTDLPIAQTANITTDATGHGGATVSYAVPAVTDPDDPSPPAASCTPASAAAFSIGVTTVQCSATDADDTPSTMSTSFTATVKGAATQLAVLATTVRGIGLGASLAHKVAAAQSSLANGDTADACDVLIGFINEVKAQSGTHKSVPVAEAARLIADASRIQTVMVCRR